MSENKAGKERDKRNERKGGREREAGRELKDKSSVLLPNEPRTGSTQVTRNKTKSGFLHPNPLVGERECY